MKRIKALTSYESKDIKVRERESKDVCCGRPKKERLTLQADKINLFKVVFTYTYI